MDVLWGDASIQNIQQTDYVINNNINVQWQVGVCYRPEEDQAHMLQKINNSINTTENVNCLLLGDLNFRKTDWSKGK